MSMWNDEREALLRRRHIPEDEQARRSAGISSRTTAGRMNHSWSPPISFFNERGEHWKTERSCTREGCAVIKVTRHQPEAFPPHWREWWKDGERIMGDATPPCIEFGEVAAL